MKRILFILIAYHLSLIASFAQSPSWGKKAAQGVFTLKTFPADRKFQWIFHQRTGRCHQHVQSLQERLPRHRHRRTRQRMARGNHHWSQRHV